MNFLLIGRVAKLAALLAFLLPWVTVSCSGTVLFEATGVQLMTGDIQANPALSSSDQASAEDGEPSIPAIAAFAAIALGLLLSLATKGRAAAVVIMIGAVAGIGLSYYTVENLNDALASQMQGETPEASQQQPQTLDEAFAMSMSQLSGQSQSSDASQLAAALQVREQEGYWATLLALGVALIMALLVLAGAGAQATAPAPEQHQTPPSG